MNYQEFLDRKTHLGGLHGFAPGNLPDFLFDFQKALTEWALLRGRAAIFADCGLGKTPMQLVWADEVVRRTKGRVLILTPLAVGAQTVAQGERFGIECKRSRAGEGVFDGAPITVANYEQLHRFSFSDFAGVVCDESSILKHFSGSTQKNVTRFMAKIPHRLLCTATAAPNDYTELGTSSEALGELGYTDMLSRFFKQSDKQSHRMQEIKDQKAERHNYFGKLAYRAAQQIGQWKLKGHAEIPFWKWVASWARACRRPSDLGFSDGQFILPPLEERHHVVSPRSAREGMLFTIPAFGLAEEREERRRTLRERCEKAAELATSHGRQVLLFVQYNSEGDLLQEMIPGALQVAGSDSDDAKEERLLAFASSKARVLITKAKIAGFGLNFQNCAHVITFATHSYEGYYQSIRRCWRFGQKADRVVADIISTEGEQRVAANMERKSKLMEIMFDRMVEYMEQSTRLERRKPSNQMEIPSWMSSAIRS